MPAGRVIFVTGFPGFIGRRLVRRLAERTRVARQAPHERGEQARLVLLVQPASTPAARAALDADGIEAELV